MSFWNSRNLRACTGGSWLRRPAGPDPDRSELANGLSTDTRSIRPGEAFVALRGERFDAHEFLETAAAAGAALLIVDQPRAVPSTILKSGAGPAVLKVPDTRRALGQLAAAYRASLEGLRVVAVVGSNGKTTTTRLIHAVLSARMRGSCSPKSFNNDVGLPLTLLGARPGDQFVVCEVGSNHPGETSRLARICQPDVVVITSVGRDHLEFFGSTDAVAREHASMLVDLRPGGLAIVPHSERRLDEFLRPVPQVITFGRESGADLRLTESRHVSLAQGQLGLRFRVGERSEFEMSLLGEHNALNALAAVAVGRRFGLDDASIAKGLAAASPADMRLNLQQVRGSNLLVDCYNSNPDSLLAAVQTFRELSAGAARRVLVIGDMLEMGDHADDLHRQAGEEIAQGPPADVVVTVGPSSLHFAHPLQRAWTNTRFMIFSHLDDSIIERIVSVLRPGDWALLKASRGIRLERIVTAYERAATLETPAHRPAGAPA